MPRKEANHMPDKKELKKFRKEVREATGEDLEVTKETLLEFSGADPEELKELGLL
jgi:hypothetical protein